jgi:hypothetical protein
MLSIPGSLLENSNSAGLSMSLFIASFETSRGYTVAEHRCLSVFLKTGTQPECTLDQRDGHVTVASRMLVSRIEVSEGIRPNMRV